MYAVLLTQGSGTIKAGFAGQDTPKCFFPNLYVADLTAAWAGRSTPA